MKLEPRVVPPPLTRRRSAATLSRKGRGCCSPLPLRERALGREVTQGRGGSPTTGFVVPHPSPGWLAPLANRPLPQGEREKPPSRNLPVNRVVYRNDMATTPKLSDSEPQRSSLPVLPANVDAPTATGGPLPIPPHNHVHGPHIDYELILDCVHCGLCTASCPTYVETSQRGRLAPRPHLPHAPGHRRHAPLDDDVKRHLDLCLNCRACETACPSGVQYGKLIEPFRVLHGRGRTRPAGARRSTPCSGSCCSRSSRTAGANRVAPGPGPAHAVDRPRLAHREDSGSTRLLPRSRCGT